MPNAATAHTANHYSNPTNGSSRAGHAAQPLAKATFSTALKAEFTKIRTRRSTWVWLVLFTGSLFGFPVLEAIFYDPEYGSPGTWESVVTGYVITMLLGIIYGAGVAGDFNHRMHAHSYLTQNGRNTWLMARYIVVAVFTFFATVIGVLLSAAVAAAPVGAPFDGSTSMLPLLVTILVVPAFALIGAGLAASLRNRVAAIGIPLVWIGIIEGLIGVAANTYEFAKTAYMYVPGVRPSDIFMNIEIAQDPAKQEMYGDMLRASTPHSIIVIVAWMLGLAILGLVINRRIDVK